MNFENFLSLKGRTLRLYFVKGAQKLISSIILSIFLTVTDGHLIFPQIKITIVNLSLNVIQFVHIQNEMKTTVTLKYMI